MNLLRRMLGRGRPGDGVPAPLDDAAILSSELSVAPAEPGAGPSEAAGMTFRLADAAPGVDAAEPRPDPIACPYCAALIDPPPRSRRCPSCRQPVIVRRWDGSARYLTESAAAVVAAQRNRRADERRWFADRARWLALARSVHAPEDLRRQVVAMPLSDRAVEAAREMYRAAADQTAREARKAEQWVQLSRVRSAQATALYADRGSPLPPPDDILALYREGRAAVLRSLASHSTVAELAGSACCKACRAADGELVSIAAELRKSRLPHAGCPRGLCDCDWFIAVPEAKPLKRRRPRPAASPLGTGFAATSRAAGPDPVAAGPYEPSLGSAAASSEASPEA